MPLIKPLNRHRGKGQQKVTVEHVHVHSGGQAIVGAVAPGEGFHRRTRNKPMQSNLPTKAQHRDRHLIRRLPSPLG
jgi:hypothetical protein